MHAVTQCPRYDRRLLARSGEGALERIAGDCLLQVEALVGLQLLVTHAVQHIVNEAVEAGLVAYLSVRCHYQVVLGNDHYQLVLSADSTVGIAPSHPDLIAVALASVILVVLLFGDSGALEYVRSGHGFHPFPVQQLFAMPHSLVLQEDAELGKVGSLGVHAAVAHVPSVHVHLPDNVSDPQRVEKTRLEVLVESEPRDTGDDVGEHVRAGDVVCEGSARFMGVVHGEERPHLVQAGAWILRAGMSRGHRQQMFDREPCQFGSGMLRHQLGEKRLHLVADLQESFLHGETYGRTGE